MHQLVRDAFSDTKDPMTSSNLMVRSAPLRRWYLAAIVVAATVSLRVLPAFFLASDAMIDPNTDSRGYIDLAMGLRHGCGFMRLVNEKCWAIPAAQRKAAIRGEAIDAQLDRTPGYPVFLRLLPNLRSALIVQGFLFGLLALVMYTFVTKLWGTGAALLTGAFIVFDVPSIVYSNEIMTEALFTVLFVLGIACTLYASRKYSSDGWRIALLALASIIFCAAILVRPVGELAFWVPAMIPLFLIKEHLTKRLGYVVCLVAIPIIAIAGWSLRNYRLTGVATFSPVGAKNFFYYRAGGTLAYASDGQRFKLTLQPDLAGLTTQAFKIIASNPVAFSRMSAWSFLYLCTVPDVTPLKHMLGIRRTFPLRDPGSMRAASVFPALRTAPRKALANLYIEEFDSSWKLVVLCGFQLVVLLILWNGVILAWPLFGLTCFKNGSLTICALTAFWLLALAAGPEAGDRFRIPAIPLLALVSSVGWMNAWGRQVMNLRADNE